MLSENQKEIESAYFPDLSFKNPFFAVKIKPSRIISRSEYDL